MQPENRQPLGQSRFVSNTTALLISTLVTTFLTLAQVKILTAFLEPEAFGLFAALRGLSLLVALLAANGFPQLLVRFLPQHESRKRITSAIVLSGVCFFVPLFLLTVFVFVIESNRAVVFDFPQSAWLKTAGSEAGLFIWFYATTLGVTLKLVLYGGFNGLRRLPAQVSLELASLIVQVAWIYAWRDQLTLTRLFMVLGVTSLAPCAVGFPWYFVRLTHDVSPRGKTSATTVEDASTVGYGEYWLGATGLSLVAVAFTDVDRYVLSRVLLLEVLSQFHVGSRVLRLVNRFLAVPVLAFQPEITRLDAERRSDAIEASTRVFFKFSASIAAVAAFAIWSLAPEIIRLISSARYDAAVPLLRILVVSIPLAAMTAPITAVMKALDQVRRALYCDLTWAVVYISLLLLLGGAYGLVGAGLAQVLASLFQLSLAVSLSRPRIGAGFPLSVAGKVVVSGLVAFVPMLAVGALLPLSAAAVAAKAVLLVLALLLFRVMSRIVGVFSREEREVLIALSDKSKLGALASRLV
jgi:O-antigen/teichoic acid export membrane protein